MDETYLQDRLYWGLNRAATVLGRLTDVYRPKGNAAPLERSNRYIQMRAAFSRADGNFSRSVGYGVSEWRGYFDASYTRIGDYLVQGRDVWFVAEQRSLLPVLCVKTNRVISVTRQLTPITGISNGPSAANSSLTVLSGWPASQLGTGTEGKSPARLPADTTISNWIILIPTIEGQVLQPADIVSDDLGTNGIIVAVEHSDLGWRLNVRQVTT